MQTKYKRKTFLSETYSINPFWLGLDIQMKPPVESSPTLGYL